MKIFYKIENGYPIVDYPPAIDETFLEGTKETVDGVDIFTPQELQDAINAYKVKEELEIKINEANSYLKETDWVESYKIRHDLGLELIPEDSSKWEVLNKREEYKLFLKGVL